MRDTLPDELLQSRESDDFFFVQIGAHDGISWDPIRPLIERYGWSGLMIEPQEQQYAKLETLYRENDRITTVQLAVARHTGEIKLYGHSGGDSYSGCASVLLRDEVGFSADDYTTVKCDTLENIFSANGAPAVIDLLAIDTEGYDSDIIDQIDFDRRTVRNIFFEKWTYGQEMYSSVQIIDQNQAIKRLVENGYSVIDLENNYLAVMGG